METDAEKPSNKVGYFINDKIGETSFDFLYAPSDAAKSTTIWILRILAELPASLDRLLQDGAVENLFFRFPRARVARLHQHYL